MTASVSGGAAATTITTLQAINRALHDALRDDPAVILFGEDVADAEGGGVVQATQGLSTKFGSARVRSTPISEQAIVGAGIGAALAGLRPVVEIMLMNFITVAMDQLVNHAAKLRFMSGGQTHVPLTVRTMTGSQVGSGGQHSDFLEAWLAHTPGLKVVAPSSAADAYGLLLSCIFDDDPCVFIEHLPSYWVSGPAPAPGVRIPLGKANIVREGTDVTVIGYSRSIGDTLPVIDRLKRDGVSVELIDLRTVAPFDADTVLKSVAKTRRAVVVHEAVKDFGVGAELSSRIHEALFDQLYAPVERVASRFCAVPFSKPLEQGFLYSAADIEQAIRKTLDARKRGAA